MPVQPESVQPESVQPEPRQTPRTSSFEALSSHPLVVGVATMGVTLDTMSTSAWAGIEPAVVKQLAAELLRIEARVKAQQIAAVRALEESGLAKKEGATSTGALLAGEFGGDRRDGDQMVRAAKAFDAAPRTEAAFAQGEIGRAQASIIANAIGDLPDETTAEQKQACEDTLIGDARRLTLKDLRARGRRITDQFTPEPEVDAIEDESLVAREKRAWHAAEFAMWDNRDGTHSGSFHLPDAQADMLAAAVRAISAPRRDHLHDHPGAETAEGESVYDRDLEFRHRLGMGFAELCGHLPTDRLPGKNGLSASLTVRFDYDTLVRGIRPGTLSTGTRISASQVRLMACNAGLLPQVFDGASLPIDHGAEQRCFTRAQKRALADRDLGCTFPGCDRPPEQTEAHHAVLPWSICHTTCLAEGVLICPFHHRIVHADSWEIRFSPHDGHAEYRRPGATDWVRNQRWRP